MEILCKNARGIKSEINTTLFAKMYLKIHIIRFEIPKVVIRNSIVAKSNVLWTFQILFKL